MQNHFIHFFVHLMSIAAGKNSFVVIDLYGEVWISGMNNLNQFGVKCLVEHDAHPYKLPQFGFFIDVKCTEKNLILLDKDGFVWKSIPQQSSVTTLQKKTKRVVETHFSKDIPINFLRISEIKSVKEIAAGDEHFMILDCLHWAGCPAWETGRALSREDSGIIDG